MAKTDYKKMVLEYLQSHSNEDISRIQLISECGISKSRLSEVLKSIKNDGYTIISPARSGLIRLETTDNQIILPTITDRDIRMWFIIFLLARFGKLSFRDLILKSLKIKDYESDYSLKLNTKKVFDDNHLIKSLRSEMTGPFLDAPNIDVASDGISVTTLRKDLSALRKLGLVSIIGSPKSKYELTSKAPFIISVSTDSLFEFCQKYEEHITTTSELLPVKQAYNKIQNIISWDSADHEQRRFGKLNQINQKQIDKFNDFISHPYKENRITIHSSYNGRERHDTISVGLLFYSVETGAFYALCKNHTQNRIEADRIDFVGHITDTDEANSIFHSPDYYKIYDEMFAAGFEPNIHHVKILLQEFGNVIPRFRSLASIRKNASIRPINSPSDDCAYKFVYEDNIRGLDDFARFLRSFGYSVLAVEPQELKEKMMNTYNRTLEKYKHLEEESLHE